MKNEISKLHARQKWIAIAIIVLAYFVYAHETAIGQISSFLVRLTGGR